MTSPILDRDAILRAIQSWPFDQQLALAQEITRRALTPSVPATHAPFEEALGLLATPGKLAPSDEDIERLRMERYREA